MSRHLIETANTKIELKPSPIEPSWIIDGNPVAQNAVLSRSADGTASTIVWQCTDGRFNWHYDIDETIYILEGKITLESDTMRSKVFGPGDVIFFRRGAHARWNVQGHVRKIAFCRQTQPAFIGLALRAMTKFKKLVTPQTSMKNSSLLGT